MFDRTKLYKMDRPLIKPRVILYRFIDVFITSGRLKFDYVNITSENLNAFLDEFYQEPELEELLVNLRDMSVEDYDQTGRRCPLIFKPSQPQSSVRDSISLYMNWRMKLNNKACLGRHRDAPDCKLIQWVVAYALASGHGKVTVHQNYAVALKQRSQMDIKQYVYSRMTRGVLDQQRRLLAFSTEGDLTQWLDGYLNSAMYAPSKASSYSEIANMLQVQPGQMLLVSTDVNECVAATKAGCAVVRIKRPGELKNRTYPRVQDMSFITFMNQVSPSTSKATVTGNGQQGALTKQSSSGQNCRQKHSKRESKGSLKIRSSSGSIKKTTNRREGSTNSSTHSLGSNKSISKKRRSSSKKSSSKCKVMSLKAVKSNLNSVVTKVKSNPKSESKN